MAFHLPIPDDKQSLVTSADSPKLSGGLGTLVEAEKLIQIAILLPSVFFRLAGRLLRGKERAVQFLDFDLDKSLPAY
jgi:hypothetical protein